MGGCSEAFSQTNPRTLSQPRLPRESPHSWSWQLLEGPKQVPQHQLSQAAAKSVVRCQRGSPGKGSLLRQLGRGPGFMGQQPGQAHTPGDGLQDRQSQAPSCPLCRPPRPAAAEGPPALAVGSALGRLGAPAQTNPDRCQGQEAAIQRQEQEPDRRRQVARGVQLSTKCSLNDSNA